MTAGISNTSVPKSELSLISSVQTENTTRLFFVAVFNETHFFHQTDQTYSDNKVIINVGSKLKTS